MIHCIEPRIYNPILKNKKPSHDDFILHYHDNKILLIKSGENYSIPLVDEVAGVTDISKYMHYLFSIDDRSYYCLLQEKLMLADGFIMEEFSPCMSVIPDYQVFAALTGSQLYRWLRSRRYCGFCKSKMVESSKEHALICTSCGQTEYPKICPVVIVAIINNDKLLMSRYADGIYDKYALIAGYVEIGETLEDCVRRETLEEVGLAVKNIRYYKSQPWGQSDIEMVGFVAELDGEDIIKLGDELSEAGWFSRDEVNDYNPCFGLGQELMKDFSEGKI